MNIYIVTHKDACNWQDQSYKAIQVGHALSDYDIDGVKIFDDTGDNISAKNKSYCELTGLYWIWKNDTSLDNNTVGIVHYRRYFGYKKKMSPKEIQKRLLTNDIILSKNVHLPGSVKYDYCMFHYAKDFEVLRQVLSERAPDYIKDFDYFFKGHYIRPYNMMICKKSLLNEYCAWLFDILFEVENRIDISHYDSKQRRIFGYLAERLLNVWVIHNKLAISSANVHFTEFNLINWIKGRIYYLARYCFHIDIYVYQVKRKLCFYHNQ